MYCVVSEPGLIAGASFCGHEIMRPKGWPSRRASHQLEARCKGLRPRCSQRGRFHSPWGCLVGPTQTRLLAGIIGSCCRMQVCSEWEISCVTRRPLPAALTAPKTASCFRCQDVRPWGRGPGNWCSELLDAHNLGVKFSCPMAFCLHGCDDLSPACSQVWLRLY